MQILSLPRAEDRARSDAILSVRPAEVLRLQLLLLAFTNLVTIPFLNLGARSAPLFLNDLLAMAVVTSGALATIKARSLRLNDVAIAALLFVAVGGLSAVAAVPRFGLTTFELVASLAYLARWVMYFAIYVVVINCVRERDVRPLWNALETTMLAFAGFGIFQSIFLPDFGPMMYPEAELYTQIDPQGHRLVSTLLEPNIAAAMIEIVLLVQIAQLAFGAPVKHWKIWLLLVALVLTLSRSGALAFVVGMLVVLTVRGLGKRIFKFIGAALVLSLAALPVLIPFAQRYEKLNLMGGSGFLARIWAWERALNSFLESPWFGVGFNTFGFVQERQGFARIGSSSYSTEGGLLFVAVMTGAVGLVVYCVMLWLVWRRSRWIWRSHATTADERGLAVGTAAATAAIIVHSVFVNSLLTPFVMFPLWVLWGLVFLVARAIRGRSPGIVAP